MSDEDYYEVQKQVEALREKVLKLEAERELATARERLRKIQNIRGQVVKSIRDTTDALSVFNSNIEVIESKITNEECIGVPSDCIPHLKSIHENSLKLASSKVFNQEGDPPEFNANRRLSKMDSTFLRQIGDNLREYEQHQSNVESLVQTLVPGVDIGNQRNTPRSQDSNKTGCDYMLMSSTMIE